MTIEVFTPRGVYLATIREQPRIADGYDPKRPWLLLVNDGTVARTPSFKTARKEALHRWPAAVFRREGAK